MQKNAGIQLLASESAGAGSLRVCDAILRNAIRRIEHPSRDREEDIHSVRTAIKHVRAILRLIRSLIGDSAFRREDLRFKKAARRLAPMRDATVGHQALRRLARSSRRKKKRSDVSVVQAHFARHVGPTHPVIREKAMHATARVLEANRKRLQKLHIAADDRHPIERGLEKVYRSCRHRMKHAFATGRDDSFHLWRIRLKNLYYELQFLLPIWPKQLGPMVARLKKVQEQVGDDHDLNVLIATLHRMPERFSNEAAVRRVHRHLQKRSQKLRRACRPLAERIFREKPSRFMHRFDRRWEEMRNGRLPSFGKRT